MTGFLCVCFFLSGATALVYEVVSLRMLGLVFGHTVHAVATVLIVFMGGLALGSAVFGGLTRRIRSPIRVYGWLELGTGAWAALLPLLFGWSAAGYPDLFRALGRSYAVLPWIQFAIGAALLLLPTTLMGATLPVLSQTLARTEHRVGRLVGGLYAVNTCIAVLVVPVIVAFERLPEILLAALRWSQAPEFVLWVQLGLSIVVFLPVTLLLGATFPCAVAVATRGTARLGEAVGRIYAANTLGAVAGAVLTGFVLVPALGVHASILAGVVVNLLLAALLAAASDLRPAWRWGSAGAALLGGVAVVMIGPWDQRVMSSGPAVYGAFYLRSAEASLTSVRDALRSQRILFYRDGRAATVSVGQEGGNRYLRINGKTEGSTSLDMPTQLM